MRLAGPDAPVPTCPGWVVRDLVRHTGGVHRWATAYVGRPRTELWDVDLDEIVGTWPADADLVGWFREGDEALAGALEAAPADLSAGRSCRAPSPLAMWARRQAHETAIHRVDAELAAGVPLTPFRARLRRRRGRRTAGVASCPGAPRNCAPRSPPRLVMGCTDDGGGLAVAASGPRASRTEPVPSAERGADCTVRGSAADLYLALWNRSGPEALVIDGEGDVLRLFLDTVRVRWS